MPGLTAHLFEVEFDPLPVHLERLLRCRKLAFDGNEENKPAAKNGHAAGNQGDAKGVHAKRPISRHFRPKSDEN